MKIEWEKLNTVRVRELTDAQTKHLTIKALIVQRLLLKYPNRNWIHIYTEYPVCQGKVCDVYFENLKTKEVYCYEIQKKITTKWLKETKAIYDKYEVPFMKTDWVIIPEKKLSNNIQELKQELDNLIM